MITRRLLLLILFAGCDAAPGTADADAPLDAPVEVSRTSIPDPAPDSAGIQIVQNETASSRGELLVGATPLTVIGGDSSREGHELFRVKGALRLRSGNIVVANSGSSELRLFTPGGELVWSAGGPGDGPGEFRSLSTVFLLEGDSIAAFDVQLRRISVVDPEGLFVRSIPVGGPPSGPAPLARTPGGLYLMATAPVFSLADQGPTRTERLSMHMYRFSEDDGAAPVAEVPGLEIQIAPAGTFLPDGSPRYGRSPRLFGRSTTIVADALGWVVADNDRAEVQFWDPDGRLVTTARWESVPRVVTAEDVERDRAWDLAQRSNPDSAQLRQIWSQAPDPPETMPAFGTVLLDSEESVWVGEYRPRSEGTSREYGVLGRDGSWIGTAVVPEGLQILSIGSDWILALARDDLGVESIVLHSLTR